jgi:thioesterase domain-containing protein
LKTRPEPAVEKSENVREPLWVVQEGRGAAPFVFVLAGYGDAWVATGLARSLGQDHPVYGLQPPGVPAKPGSARQMAAMYIERLRGRQPHGPYFLGGYSAGAVIALEIAHQLQTQGEEVRLVALLDPLFLRYTKFELRCYLGLQRACAVVAPIFGKQRHMKILFAMFKDQGLDAHLTALAGYEPQTYNGELVYYKARLSVFGTPMLIQRWKRIAPGRLKVVRVPGDHHTFIRAPHVAGLARSLRSILQQP